MPDSIREALEAAIDEKNKPEEGGPEKNPEESVRPAAEEPKPPVEEPKSVDEPKPSVEESKPVEGAKPVESTPASEYRPPQSWRPAVREHWSKLPAEVQAEVTKREVEVNRALVQSAEARKFHHEFHQVVSPFEGIIRSQNSTPIQAVQNLMQTSAPVSIWGPLSRRRRSSLKSLRTSASTLICDQMLAGQVPPPEEDRISRVLEQQLAPVRQFMQQVQKVALLGLDQ